MSGARGSIPHNAKSPPGLPPQNGGSPGGDCRMLLRFVLCAAAATARSDGNGHMHMQRAHARFMRGARGVPLHDSRLPARRSTAPGTTTRRQATATKRTPPGREG
eukprot:6794621-Prymnesium_polylepis.2